MNHILIPEATDNGRLTIDIERLRSIRVLMSDTDLMEYFVFCNKFDGSIIPFPLQTHLIPPRLGRTALDPDIREYFDFNGGGSPRVPLCASF